MSIPRPVQIGSRFLALLLALVLAACAGDAPPSNTSDATATEQTETPDPSPPPSTDAARIDGAVSFQVEGRTVELDYLPEDENYYMRPATAVVARSGPDSEEQFMLIFVSADMRAQEIPGEFPPEGAGTSVATAMSVGFSYIDPSGEEWAGPGRVYVESFTEAGVLTARFDSVTIPHTDEELPDLTLTNGRIRAEL